MMTAGAAMACALLLASAVGCDGPSSAGLGGLGGGAGTGSTAGTGGTGSTGDDGGTAGIGGTPGAGTGGAQTGTSLELPLAQASVSLQGGSAPSPGGHGQNGGALHLVSQGAITIDPALPAPMATVAAPAGAIAVSSSDLAADLTVPGSVLIDGAVTTTGTDPVRQISASGDIFIQGTLRTADLGAGRQGLTLRAGGTVYVTGTLDASGAAGSGQAGGPVTIVAGGLVVAGTLTTAGSDGGPQGGQGGDLRLQIGGDAVLGGSISIRGGAIAAAGAVANGGNAGTFVIDCDSTVMFAGTFDARGGTARAAMAGGAVAGGAAGAIKVGETAPPKAIQIRVPLLVTGGDGDAVGGTGGAAHLEPHAGDLRIAGVLDVSGGSSSSAPGAGGTIDGNPGPDTLAGVTTAGVDVAGQVIANGGSIAAGGSGNGADGGVIKLVVLSTDGNMTLEATGQIQTDGGKSGGSGRAGGGGLMYLFTRDGAASIAGQLLARGGAAPDAGGTGGIGGFVYVFTDDNHGGTQGGALVIQTSGHIDASGGDGTIGGSARSDGRAGAVATWPVVQDNEYDVEQIAVLINSDGKHGSATGYIDNQGLITAHGGNANGSGGDIQYHGRRQDGNETPLSGNLDMAGNGTGAAGDFAGE